MNNQDLVDFVKNQNSILAADISNIKESLKLLALNEIENRSLISSVINSNNDILTFFKGSEKFKTRGIIENMEDVKKKHLN